MTTITVTKYTNEEHQTYIAVRNNGNLIRLFLPNEEDKALAFAEEYAEDCRKPKPEPQVLHTITIND